MSSSKHFAFFPGCLIPAKYPAMEYAIRATLPKLGIEIVDLEVGRASPPSFRRLPLPISSSQ